MLHAQNSDLFWFCHHFFSFFIYLFLFYFIFVPFLYLPSCLNSHFICIVQPIQSLTCVFSSFISFLVFPFLSGPYEPKTVLLPPLTPMPLQYFLSRTANCHQVDLSICIILYISCSFLSVHPLLC